MGGQCNPSGPLRGASRQGRGGALQLPSWDVMVNPMVKSSFPTGSLHSPTHKAHSMACSYEYLMPEKCLSLLPNHQVENNKAGRYSMPFLAHWAEYIDDPASYVKTKISTILTRPLRLTKPYCSANLAESVHHFRLGSRYDG